MLAFQRLAQWSSCIWLTRVGITRHWSLAKEGFSPVMTCMGHGEGVPFHLSCQGSQSVMALRSLSLAEPQEIVYAGIATGATDPCCPTCRPSLKHKSKFSKHLLYSACAILYHSQTALLCDACSFGVLATASQLRPQW